MSVNGPDFGSYEWPDWQAEYAVTVSTYRDGNPVGQRVVARESSKARAEQVVADYVADFVKQGGTATFYGDEFRIGMKDESAIYIRVWETL